MSGRKPNSRVATPRGRSSVAELVTRYQDIFDCADPPSADQETKTWEKSFPKKKEAAQPGIDLRNFPEKDPVIMNEKPREKLELQKASPSTTKTKKLSQGRSGTSSPNMVGHVNQTSNFHPSKTGGKMETLHHPKIRFQPRMEHPVPSSLRTNRREEQRTSALALHGGDFGKKETPLKRIHRASPSAKLTLTYPARQVNSDEKFPGVLAAADNRNHTLPQGEGFFLSFSVKERSALYLSRVAAAAAYSTYRPTERSFVHQIPYHTSKQVGPQEICGLCYKQVHPGQRLVIENVPMHQMCFCCQHCRRKLNLLSYAVFQGDFYCKVCSNLLAEVIGKRAPDTTLGPNPQQLPLKDTQPNPRQESKNESGPTRRILAREKMPQRSSNSYLQGNRNDKMIPQDKLKTICSPLKKDIKKEIGKKHDRYGAMETWLQDSAMVLHSPQRSDRSYYKTWEDKSIPESFGEQKKNQLPRVMGPKCGDRVLHWNKKICGLGALENRQLFVDEGIVGVQVGKIGPRVLEKARRFQSSKSEVERSVSKVTSLSLNFPRSSLGGPFLSSEGALRHTTVTPVATTVGVPQLAKDRFQGKKSGGGSSRKVTSGGKNPRQMVEPLPKVRTMLPALVPPLEQRSKKKLQRATQKNTLDTLITEDAKEPNYNTMAPMKGEEPSQTKSETLASSLGPEEKKNDQTEHSEKTLASSVDPMKSCLKNNQEPKRNELLGKVTEIVQTEKQPSMDNQFSPETLPLNEEDKKNEMHPREISDNFVIPECFSVSQDTEPKGRTSSSATDGNIDDASSSAISQANDVENREVLPRNSLRGHATLICNPEPPPEITKTNEKLPTKASSGHNLQLAFQEDTSRDISILSSAKDPEILPSCEVSCLIEKQETEHENMEIKAQHESVTGIETSRAIIDKPARKQPLKKQKKYFAQFFASKEQRSISHQKLTSGTKKAPKTQSALLTLFGHSVNKDKSQKEWPRKGLGEVSGKADLQSTDFSSLSKPDFSKKDENSGVVLQKRNSKAGSQNSEESHGSCSRGNQNEKSPTLDNVNTVFLELEREISSLTRIHSLHIPKKSNMNTEHTAEEPEKSLPLTSFQSYVVSTENMSPYSANTLVETSVSCRNILSEQDWDKVDSQDLELKARNVSLLVPSAKDETRELHEDDCIPDTLSSFKGMEESASMEKENVEPTPGSDTEFVQVKDHFCSGSSENVLQLSSPQFTELQPNMAIKDDGLINSQPPEIGNSQTLESNSDHPFEIALHVEQATNDDYSIEENHFHPVLIPFQPMPELLRDTLWSKTTERSAEAKSSPKDQMQASDSCHPHEQLL